MAHPFAQVPEPRIAELRQPIGLVLAYGMQRSTESMCHDDSVTPAEMIVAMLDAHALGLASAIAAAVRDLQVSRDDLVTACSERLRKHLSEMPA